MGRLFAVILLALLASAAQAHKASDSYLSLTPDSQGLVQGRWDIALRDLDVVLDLDADGDRQLTWGEVRAREGDIARYAFAHLQLQQNHKDCLAPVPTAALALDTHADGHYAVLQFTVQCAAGDALAVDYRLFADVDALHRGITTVTPLGQPAHTVVLVPGAGFVAVQGQDQGAWKTLLSFIREGVHHIVTGYDHLLFLLSLLLPAALLRRHDRWEPVPRWTRAFAETAAVVTAFTIAHSMTLALAALNIVSVNSRLVESLIALSVVLAALHNLRPVFQRGRWLLAFCFGLVHGFGFASALRDLPVAAGERVLALAGFNIGVELGQLLFVAGFLPLALLARRSPAYTTWVLRGGSVAVALVATVWLCQRALDLRLIPG